ncbi:MAG: hypothetical protein A4S12_02275 [Proteobacteria bacterium SG_bin5]|nr:cytochrome P460 family protein [Sphingomonas sp.]OQW39397.1 MAG: hypothetical protein A4S12_02275 [Proteobacteria bacterium SG_bin5]
MTYAPYSKLLAVAALAVAGCNQEKSGQTGEASSGAARQASAGNSQQSGITPETISPGFERATEDITPQSGPPQPYAREGARRYVATFTPNGEMIRPYGWRDWKFIGTPLTPNGLNNGKSSFPEFHVVYMEPSAYDHYQRTGQFRDGTVLIKELTLVQKNSTTGSGGSTQESSGRGYFMAEYSGLEAAVKDSKRFPNEPGNWAYFTFGHVPEAKYASLTKAEPAETCNACHQQNAKEDYVFSQHYPVLRGLKARVNKQ